MAPDHLPTLCTRAEREPSVGGVQSDQAWAQGVELDGQGEQALGEAPAGGYPVVGIGRPEQEQDGQAGTPAEQGMYSEAAQAAAGMLGGSVTDRRIRVVLLPGHNGGAVADEVPTTTDPPPHGDGEEQCAGDAQPARGSPHAARAGQATSQSCVS